MLPVNDGRVDSNTGTVTVNIATIADLTNGLGMTFNQIPSGTFTMGSPENESGRSSAEGPQHQVSISQFYMQTTEVTQGQWRAVMGSNPSYFSSCGDSCPVESVSWGDIQIFLARLNASGIGIYRLPTEAEWEYAARAGTTGTFSFGSSSDNLSQYAWHVGNSSDMTHPVAQKLANLWGLYDMHGNVLEWVSDWSGPFTSTAVTDPQGPSYGPSRIVRGGGYGGNADDQRSAIRHYITLSNRYRDVGFRLVLAYSVTNNLGMTFNQIPAGTFTMGSPENETGRSSAEGPQHQVSISQFYMQTTEVTQGQWRAVMGSNPSNFSSCGDSCPVESVSSSDIQTFLVRLNERGIGTYRLPTEAEWEYAARAGTTGTFSFGPSSASLGWFAWYSGNSSNMTHPVAQKLANLWGLYDMHGNVLEWVSDWSGPFTSTAETNPQGPSSGSSRIVRGGGYSGNADSQRSARRLSLAPSSRYFDLGLRLVAANYHPGLMTSTSSTTTTTTTTTVPAYPYPDCYASVIQGSTTPLTLNYGDVVTLSNGSSWEVLNYYYGYHYGGRVAICPDSRKLIIEGHELSVRRSW
ncbi:MAG: formylglycine-generating enzyme family protein [Magnetococcales bacterium]|nr:formylglycine-generating enzyme family protein [Magnetococcales bacterium]